MGYILILLAVIFSLIFLTMLGFRSLAWKIIKSVLITIAIALAIAQLVYYVALIFR